VKEFYTYVRTSQKDTQIIGSSYKAKAQANLRQVEQIEVLLKKIHK